MNQFIHFGSLIFNRDLITWIDFAIFNEQNLPAIEVKVNNDPETWKLTGPDRDAALTQMSLLRIDPVIRLFGTKAFALREIKWVNRNGRTADGLDCFEIVMTDGTAFQLRDNDAADAESYFDQLYTTAGR